MNNYNIKKLNRLKNVFCVVCNMYSEYTLSFELENLFNGIQSFSIFESKNIYTEEEVLPVQCPKNYKELDPNNWI